MATHSSILAQRIHYEILWDMRYYLTLVRMNIIKKFKINAGEGREKKGTLLHCWWEYKLVQLLWRTVWRFLKKLKIGLPYNLAIPLTPGYTSRKGKNSNFESYMHPNICSSSIYDSKHMETTQHSRARVHTHTHIHTHTHTHNRLLKSLVFLIHK